MKRGEMYRLDVSGAMAYRESRKATLESTMIKINLLPKWRRSVALAFTITFMAPAGWSADTVKLIQGKDMSNWAGDTGTWFQVGEAKQSATDPKLLEGESGAGVIINGSDGRTKNLISKAEHGDCILKIDFMVPRGSNSGVYLQGRYEIQVLDSFGVKEKDLGHGDCGGIYQRYAEGKGVGYEGRPPRTNASKKPGEWQSYEIWFRAPRFSASGSKTEAARFVKVVHNGVVIHENEEVSGPTRAATWLDSEKPQAPLMLQGDHGPVAYRNIELTHTTFE